MEVSGSASNSPTLLGRQDGKEATSWRGTLNSHRAAITLVRLVEREEKWEVPDQLQGVPSQNWGGTETNRTVTCMVIKTNDRRKNLALSHDEFRGL
ncbi:hypothetical protein TNCV_2269431 [Trichonephila clavipes]|nr:hypothetical protein TNCV_2269431 [Trichonephila clavipes]